MNTFLLGNAAALGIMTVFMTAVWVFAKRIKNYGVVDIFWSLLIVLLAVIYFVFFNGYAPRMTLMLSMVLFWGFRLAVYILIRGRGHGEEARYHSLREKWGAHADSKMLRFYWMQGVGAVLFSWPFLLAAMNPSEHLGFFEFSGAWLLMLAICGEGIADYQLKTFKDNPENRGKVCRVGLWNYSRHPNYFFEWLVWTAFAWFALSSPLGGLAVLCPISMYYFLNRVTGIPMTEEQSLKSRGDLYKQYQKEVNSFFPGPPRRDISL